MSQLFSNDSKPWYRQFWPWFLIVLPGSVVIAGLTTVVIASRHADDLVVDEYYKTGLAINQQLEKKEQAQSLGIHAQLKFSPLAVSASLSGDVNDTALTLILSHPMESDRDFELQMDRVEDGFYVASLQQSLHSRWYWTLVNSSSPAWRLDGSVDLPPAAPDK